MALGAGTRAPTIDKTEGAQRTIGIFITRCVRDAAETGGGITLQAPPAGTATARTEQRTSIAGAGSIDTAAVGATPTTGTAIGAVRREIGARSGATLLSGTATTALRGTNARTVTAPLIRGAATTALCDRDTRLATRLRSRLTGFLSFLSPPLLRFDRLTLKPSQH
jgi:hypothetical protein